MLVKGRSGEGEKMRIIDELKKIIAAGAASSMTFNEFLEVEIKRWKGSPQRKLMLDGKRYYDGDHDILRRKREVIVENGARMEDTNLPNNKLVDNQFAKMVDQKTNYLLSKPITYESKDKEYNELLAEIFNANFQRKLKRGGVDAFCGGGSWLYVYIGTDGNLKFQRFANYEVLPFWKDSDHDELDCAVRVYEVEAYEGRELKTIEKVEVFKVDGLERYVWKDDKLIPDVDNPTENYIKAGSEEYNWERVPLVFFRTNAQELPLITKVKGLQDALNKMLSDFPNAMEENAGGQTILEVLNHGGENLGEFRRNLATYRAVKVETIDGVAGGIKALKIEINAANYEIILKLLKKAIIENAMGYDAKDDRLGGNANQMNIKSMYSDIDLAANDMESEYQAAFLQLLELVDVYLLNTKKGDHRKKPVTITFNRDIVINEIEIIKTLVSLGIKVSNETLLGQLPFINNVQKELDRVKKEQEADVDMYGGAFNQQQNGGEE